MAEAISAAAADRNGRPIEVLVVDDSAVVREMMRVILSQASGMRVTTAADPVIAQDKMRAQRPDVILLDLEMPRMDGLTFLQTIMSGPAPVPVIVCSGLAHDGADAAMRALESGAVEVLAKPALNVKGFLEQLSDELVRKVRAAAQSRPMTRAIRRYTPENGVPAVHPLPHSLPVTTDKVVVVGASTGGTEALRELLQPLPPDTPGLVIVQHMPAGFTAAFARRLNDLCRIDVKEAADGDMVTTGRALIAPGNHHMELARSGAHYMVRVFDGPTVSGHRPSVDVLFRSAAKAAGANATGVLMTGMGADGADGLLTMRQAGAHTIAQDEKTSVVFGMPKEAIARGAAAMVLPLQRIGGAILNSAHTE